jgi:hypothetical protein
MHWQKAGLVGAAFLALGLGAVGGANGQELGGSSYPGPYYLGSPDAPVTMEEYADFQ